MAANEADSFGTLAGSALLSIIQQTRLPVSVLRRKMRVLLAAVVLLATLFARGTAQLSCKLREQQFSRPVSYVCALHDACQVRSLRLLAI